MSPDAYTQMAQVQDTHWWFVARRKILHSQIKALNLPPNAVILEIGSGTGANLDLLAEFGSVTGIEMSEDAIALAARRTQGMGGVTLRQGVCPQDIGQIGKRFDLICLFDVLEHIDQDAETLRQLIQILKPGGRLMITVPAYRWMWGPHDVQLHHKRRYSMGALQACCAAAGVSAQRITYFNSLLFPLAAGVRLLDRLLNRTVASGLEVPWGPMNRAFAWVFSTERFLLDRLNMPWGLSLLLVGGRGHGS